MSVRIHPEIDQKINNTECVDSTSKLHEVASRPKTSKNSLSLQLDRSTLEQGERIKGCIKLKVIEQIAADYLNLKFKVKEETHFSNQYKEAGTVKEGDFQGRMNWFNHRYPVRSFTDNEVMMPDIYEFPFEFELDRNHPISFEFRTQKCESVILSKLKAEFKIKKRRKMKSTVIVTVLGSKQAIDKAQQRVQIEKSINCYLQNYLCFSRGDLGLRIHINKNIFHPGEDIQGTVDLDNKLGSVDIKGLRISLLKMVTVKDLKGQQGFFNDKKPEQQVLLQDVIVKSGTDRVNIPFSLKLSDNILCSVNFQLVQGTYELVAEPLLDLLIPLFQNPSVRGTLWVYRFEDQTTVSNINKQNTVSSPVVSNRDLETSKTQKIQLSQRTPISQQQTANDILIPGQQSKEQELPQIPQSSEERDSQNSDPKNVNRHRNLSVNEESGVHINLSLNTKMTVSQPSTVQNKIGITATQSNSVESQQEDNTGKLAHQVSLGLASAKEVTADLADAVKSVESPQNNSKKSIEIMWQRAMYYHPNEDKLIFTKPVWVPSHKAYMKEAMAARIRRVNMLQ